MNQRSTCFRSLLGALVCGALLFAPAALRAEEPTPHSDKNKPAASDQEGPRRRGSRGGEGPGAWSRPTPEQIEELMVILNEINPDRVPSLEEIRKQDPERFNEIIRDYMPKLVELAFLRKHDPEMFKLRVQDFKLIRNCGEIARQLRKAAEDNDAAKAKELEPQLRAKVAEHYAIRQQIRERELANLETKLADLRKKNDESKKNKDEMIEQRYNELTGKAKRTEW